MTVQKTAADLVAALRSGEFVKGRGSLRKRDGADAPWSYCCEGVMCEISGLPIVEERMSHDMKTGKVYTRFSALPEVSSDLNEYRPSVDAFAPAFVWEGTGIETSEDGTVAMIHLPIYERVPVYTDTDWDAKTYELEFVAWNTVTLASLNDYTSHNYDDPKIAAKNTFTFDQIADLIDWAAIRNYGDE